MKNQSYQEDVLKTKRNMSSIPVSHDKLCKILLETNEFSNRSIPFFYKMLR